MPKTIYVVVLCNVSNLGQEHEHQNAWTGTNRERLVKLALRRRADWTNKDQEYGIYVGVLKQMVQSIPAEWELVDL